MNKELFGPFDTKSSMNEVVRNLYEKSKELRETSWGERITYVNYNTFAKLIVEECMYCIAPKVEDQPIPFNMDTLHHFIIATVRIECIAEIKKHFGVNNE